MYTHRSNYLTGLAIAMPDGIGLSTASHVCLIVPMFHANGWAIPFGAIATGASLVLPGLCFLPLLCQQTGSCADLCCLVPMKTTIMNHSQGSCGMSIHGHEGVVGASQAACAAASQPYICVSIAMVISINPTCNTTMNESMTEPTLYCTRHFAGVWLPACEGKGGSGLPLPSWPCR